MSAKINQAVNQVRLTNVAVVRLKKYGHRFEIACYRNKVDNWRSGLETDLDEVLQIDRVFVNVSKGVVAKTQDLMEAFGTADQTECCKIILNTGVPQVTEGERAVQLANKFRNVATIVADKCVNPETKRPYPVSSIEAAMRSIHFAVAPSRAAKQQALEVIRELEKHMPLRRAQMLVRIVVDASNQAALQAKLRAVGAVPVSRDHLVDPGAFRPLSEFLSELSPPGTLEVKDFSVQRDDEADVEVDAIQSETEKAAAAAAPVSAPSSNSAAASALPPVAEAPTAADAEENGDGEEEAEGEDEGEGEGEDDLLAASSAQDLRKLRKKKKKQKRRELQQQQQEQQQQEETPAEAPPSEAAVAEGAPEPEEATPAPSTPPAPPAPAKEGGLRCLTCGVGFGDDRALQREHYRTDVHRLNLKLKMKDLPCMTADEFELLGPEERDAILHDYM